MPTGIGTIQNVDIPYFKNNFVPVSSPGGPENKRPCFVGANVLVRFPGPLLEVSVSSVGETQITAMTRTKNISLCVLPTFVLT